MDRFVGRRFVALERPRRRGRRLAVLAALVALGAVVGYGAASYVVYDRLTATEARCRGDSTTLAFTPADFELEEADQLPTTRYLMPRFEDVRLPSRDPGISIAAFWVPARVADAPAVVVVPGWNGCRRDPTNLLIAGMLHRHDIGALVIDLRDHGESTVEDGRFAGGTDEYQDVLGAWDWLRGRGVPAERIGLFGASLGAATAMIAFGEEPRVAAIWEDSSYGDIREAMRSELSTNGYPGFLEPGGILLAKVLGGDDLTAKSPLEAARRVGTRSIFITHGSADQRLTVKYAFDLAAAVWLGGGRVEPWIVDGMSHTHALKRIPIEYEARMAAFFIAALGTPGG